MSPVGLGGTFGVMSYETWLLSSSLLHVNRTHRLHNTLNFPHTLVVTSSSRLSGQSYTTTAPKDNPILACTRKRRGTDARIPAVTITIPVERAAWRVDSSRMTESGYHLCLRSLLVMYVLFLMHLAPLLLCLGKSRLDSPPLRRPCPSKGYLVCPGLLGILGPSGWLGSIFIMLWWLGVVEGL